MNVFLLDLDPIDAAACYVDDHCAFVTVGRGRPPIRSCKMAIEAVQLLSAARVANGLPTLYKATHAKHPWALACGVRSVYRLVEEYAHALLLEHEHRTGRTLPTVEAALAACADSSGIPAGEFRIPICTGETVWTSNLELAVDRYRRYYADAKITKMPRFTRRHVPEWAWYHVTALKRG